MLKIKRFFTPILMGMLITLIFVGQAAAQEPDSSWPNSSYDSNSNDRNGIDINPYCNFIDRQPDGSCLKFSDIYSIDSHSISCEDTSGTNLQSPKSICESINGGVYDPITCECKEKKIINHRCMYESGEYPKMVCRF